MKLDIKYNLFEALFPILLFLILNFIFGAFESYSIIPYIIKQSILLSVIFFYFYKRHNFNIFEKFNLNISQLIKTIREKYVILLILLIVGSIRIILGDIYNLNDMMPYDINKEFLVFMFIGAVFIAPVIEEIIFRGILLSYFVNKTKIPTTVSFIIVGLIFGLMHVQYYSNMLLLGAVIFLGYLFCEITHRYNNLTYSILIHFVNNLLGSVLLLYNYLK